MFYRINTKDLLNSTEFVNEPVDKICSDINNSSSKKIILSGGRGTGKSIVLQNVENIGINKENQTIYTIFDSVISFRQIPQEELFFNHYYELVFSLKLLNYIKKYYVLLYEKHFNKSKLFLEDIANDTDEYIRKIHYEDIELKRYLTTKEISSLIVKELKGCLKCDNLQLAIDRFDWINGNSSLAQNTARKIKIALFYKTQFFFFVSIAFFVEAYLRIDPSFFRFCHCLLFQLFCNNSHYRLFLFLSINAMHIYLQNPVLAHYCMLM